MRLSEFGSLLINPYVPQDAQKATGTGSPAIPVLALPPPLTPPKGGRTKPPPRWGGLRGGYLRHSRVISGIAAGSLSPLLVSVQFRLKQHTLSKPLDSLAKRSYTFVTLVT